MPKISKIGLLLSVLVLGILGARAQTITESGMVTSNSGMAAQEAKAPSFAMPSPQVQSSPSSSSAKASSSPHLSARNGPPPDEVNRKEFEDNAGEKAGKLLLRSMPSGASIFINDLLVGRTPLLMVIAPGPYKIEMRGARDESGHATVGIMPKETQTVVISLNQRYPASFSIR